MSHVRALPAHVGATASAFARKHPMLAMGGAAAIVMALITRNRRRHGLDGSGSSWPVAVAAVGAKFLPEILKAVGMRLPHDDDPAQDDPAELAREKNGSVAIPPESIQPVDPLAAPAH
jgi:hypothetical protein